MFTVLPSAPLLGVIAVTNGGALRTVKAAASVPAGLPGFETATSHVPATAFVRSKLHVISVALLTVTPAATMSACPVFLSETVAPATNPVPTKFVMATGPSFVPQFGVIEVTVGLALP